MTVQALQNVQQEAHRIFLNLMRARPLADPYPLYARLREIGPVITLRMPNLSEAYVVTTHAEVSEVMRRPEFGPIGSYLDAMQPGWDQHRFTRCMYKGMPFRSGQEHRSRRNAVSAPFTPRGTENHRAMIIAVVDGLLDALEAGDPDIDIEEDLALPFASLTIGRPLGLSDRTALQWGRLARAASLVFEHVSPPSLRKRAHEAGNEFIGRIAEVCAQRRRDPRDDLISQLVAHHAQAHPDDPEEPISAVAMLFGAGFDSPVSMVGLGTKLFIEHPGQARLLREDPALARDATEEVLRYEAPVQMVVRVVTRDTTLAGTDIAAGASVYSLLGSANRDGLLGTDLDQFRITRRQIQSQSFAGGPHYCLGAPLSRLQGEILFPRLLQRFPDMTIAGEPRWRTPGSALRGLESLPVRLFS